MAKTTTQSGSKPKAKPSSSKRKSTPRKAARTSSVSRRPEGDFNAVDALFKLLESPLVVDLLAVGATAALASITEARHSRRSGAASRSTKVMKSAGKAAAAAIGRRLATEFDEIRKVSSKVKESVKA
jgi:hypothetical protein